MGRGGLREESWEYSIMDRRMGGLAGMIFVQ